MDTDNPLLAYFLGNPGRMINKWMHYFDVYHRHLARYRGTPCTLVEFGVFHGGSLQMWRDYLGPEARIVGVDRNPRVSELGEANVEIVIGDQGDRRFLKSLAERLGKVDICIDDGGHTMRQQIMTFEEMYPVVVPEGTIIIEDTHTSYWAEYGGGLRSPQTFMQYAQRLTDELNAWHSRDPHSFAPGVFTRTAQSMHFYDSVVVFEKGAHPRPQERSTGTPSFPLTQHIDALPGEG